MKILVLNGPNLNFLGIREPNIYGKNTYKDLCDKLNLKAKKENIELKIFQSNHEGFLIDEIQQAYLEHYDGIVINPGGLTHTSVSLLDAVKSVMIPTIEVHISDVSLREDFRKISYVGLACKKTIKGKGIDGYIEAIDYLIELNKK